LSAQNIVVRTGTMCAVPFLAKFEIGEVIRLSFGPYNNIADIDKFFEALEYSVDKLK
jgi:cysteine sulfinate desulfinase